VRESGLVEGGGRRGLKQVVCEGNTSRTAAVSSDQNVVHYVFRYRLRRQHLICPGREDDIAKRKLSYSSS